jgi:hypothetical protein
VLQIKACMAEAKRLLKGGGPTKMYGYVVPDSNADYDARAANRAGQQIKYEGGS